LNFVIFSKKKNMFLVKILYNVIIPNF